MIEKAKTIFLILLVGTSLLQSYLLAYHSTDYESILEGEYVETEAIGTQENQKNLVYPLQIVMHQDAERHSVLYPGHYFYRLIMEDLQKQTFGDLKLTEKSGLLLNQMKNEQAGLELRFPSELPLQIVRLAVPIQTGLTNETEWIRTMWMTIDEQTDKVEVYFVGDDFSNAYEVVSSSLSKERIEQYIRFGEFQFPNYTASRFGFLYPSESISVQRIQQTFTSITSDKMENMLFPDPGITRSFPTSDGTEIYSDGKRVLEIDRSQLWMGYTDPMTPINERLSPGKAMNTIVQFINHHGGWNGQYTLERINTASNQAGPRFIFRQYMSSYPFAYPILDSGKSRFGSIEVMLQQDVVTEYERTLIISDAEKMTGGEVHLPGGDVLMKRLEKLGVMTRIEIVTPAYRSAITPEAIEFTPVWAVILKDGTILELP